MGASVSKTKTSDDLIRMAQIAGLPTLVALQAAPALKRLIALAQAAEREACAELCESYAEKWDNDGNTKAGAGADCCADGIRARSET